MDEAGEKNTAKLLPPLQVEADDLSAEEAAQTRAARQRLVDEIRQGTDDRRFEGMAALAQRLGDTELSLGMREEALNSYRRAARLLTAEDPAALRAVTHYAIAEIERSKERRGEAEASYCEAAAHYGETEDAAAQATCWLCAGEMRTLARQDASALQALDRGAELFEEVGDALGRAHVLLRRGELRQFSDPAAASADLGEARDLYARVAGIDGEEVAGDDADGDAECASPADLRNADPRALARYCAQIACAPDVGVEVEKKSGGRAPIFGALANPEDQRRLTNLGILAASMLIFAVGYQLSAVSGDIPSPVIESNKAARNMPTVTLAAERAAALQGRAAEAALRGEVGAARETYQEALAIYRRLENRSAQADVVLALARLDSATDKRALYEESRLLYEQAGNLRGEAAALAAVIAIDEASGDLERLSQSYGRRAELLEASDDRDALADSLHKLIAVQRQRADTRGMRASLLKLLAIYESTGATDAVAHTLESVGALDLHANDLRKARIRLERAYSLHRENRSASGQARALVALGDVELAADNPRQARASYRQALDLVNEPATAGVRAKALYRMGDAETVLGQQRRAVELFQQARVACLEAGDQTCIAQVDRRLDSSAS